MKTPERSGRDDLTVTRQINISENRGALIPRDVLNKPEKLKRKEQAKKMKRTTIVAAVMMFLYVGTYGVLSFGMPDGKTEQLAAVAAPSVIVQTTKAAIEPAELRYGAEPLLSEPNFYFDTRSSFIRSNATFVEADLSAMKLRYFDAGQVVFEVDILAKGREGSWWETPAGLYKVQQMKENHFSSFGQVYQPWSMVFQGNFFIHGWPEFPDGTPVPEGYSGGCIRLSTEDAAALYALIDVDVPVLVFEEDFASDNFAYEPKAPELTTEHYMVTDISNNVILAGDNIHEPLPVASIVKLMTALVAAEHINLDNSVKISPERYVDSLIPRLAGRTTVSMYSLLQLLLVESSNEAAEVIAGVIGRDNFIAKMNEKASALGLNSTHFADPSGLDDGNVASPADLMRLMQYIHNNRSFVLELTNDANLDTAYVSGEFGTLTNFNEMQGVENLIGGKVGETTAAGKTSASLHTIEVDGQERIISIILLDSAARTADVIALHDYVTERYGD